MIDDHMTDDDRAHAGAILAARGVDRLVVRLVRESWSDEGRADRAPRALLVFHLGLLAGMCDRLLKHGGRAAGAGGN